MRRQTTPLRTRLWVLLALAVLALLCLVSVIFWPDGPLTAWLRATQASFGARPAIFGGFHLGMLALCVAAAVAMAVLYPKLHMTEERLDRLLFAAGVVLFFLELYKQLYHHTVLYQNGYNYGILPFQLCSYSMYLYLLIPLLPAGRVKAALTDFVALYLIMGACIVMAYPQLYPDVALSLHTMVWHTIMIAIGMPVLLYTTGRRPYLTRMLSAGAVFLSTVALATVLNVVLHPLSATSPQPLNLFYISPYHQSTYIIIGDVQAALGWFPSVLTYIGLFLSIGTHTVYISGVAIRWVQRKASGGRAGIKFSIML